MTSGAATGDTFHDAYHDFHDLIAKAVHEHERVLAENSQLRLTIDALQPDKPASTLSATDGALPVATIPIAPKGSPKLRVAALPHSPYGSPMSRSPNGSPMSRSPNGSPRPWKAPVARRLPIAPAFPLRETDLPTSAVPDEAPWSSSKSPEAQIPSSGSSIVPARFTQSTEEWRAHRRAHAAEMRAAHNPLASRKPKCKTKHKLGVARIGSPLPTPHPRQSGRFTVQKSVSFDEADKRSGSSATLMTLALPATWRRMLEESACVSSMRRVVEGPVFNSVFSIAVVAYAVFIGYEAAWVARNLQQQSENFDITHGIFNLIFLVELIMRFVADGKYFFTGEAWRWNVLDLFLVLASGIDFFILRSYMQVSHNSGGIRTVRFARILRLMRTVRILRTVKSVHELHKMLYSFLSSMRTLLCASLVLAFVMYFFSILFTVASAEQRMMNFTTDQPLHTFYGTLGRTFRSLFWAMSNGKSWGEIYEPIADIHWAYGFSFFTYIIITTFGVLNVVSSVFVESALLSAQFYSDLLIKDKEYEKAVASGHMMAVFRQMDQRGSGEITRDEMEFFLRDPELRQYLEALDLSADDTRMLFRLLDQDCSGVIDMDEFCSGCLKLKGQAKSIDVQILMLQMHRFFKKWSDFTEYVEDQFTSIDKALSEPDVRPKTTDDV